MINFWGHTSWPAFSKPIDDTVLSRHLDTSLNRQRIEVRSKTSNAHLGHVFTDGPKETVVCATALTAPP